MTKLTEEMTREDLFFEAETRKHQQEVAKIMMLFAQEILRRAMVHDASKLEDPERETFIRVTPLLRELTYGSPEYKVALQEMGPALDHHYKHNPHHPEYHNINGHTIPFGDDTMRAMDLLDIVEMACDWMAATKRHADGDIGKSIEHNRERFGIDVQLTQILANTTGKLKRLEDGIRD